MAVADRALLSCPWLQSYDTAAYACDSVMRFLFGPDAFSSDAAMQVYRARAGFMVNLGPGSDSTADDDSRLLGALLAKYAHRGVVSPCSVALESSLLKAAQDAGVIEYDESSASGEYTFRMSPLLDDLNAILTAHLLPELLVSESAVEELLGRYRALCSPAELAFHDLLSEKLSDPRLTLLVLPQRRIDTMLRHHAAGSAVNAAGRVDFAVEVPDFETDGLLRIAIEIDDGSHSGTQHDVDKARNEELGLSGWQTTRLQTAHPDQWNAEAERIAQLLSAAVPPEVLEGANALEALPTEQRRAVNRLMAAPVAEAQLSAVVAEILYYHGAADIEVVDECNVGLQDVVSAIRDTVHALAAVHGIKRIPDVSLSPPESRGPQTVKYYAFPSASAWDAIAGGQNVVAPVVVSADYAPTLYPAPARPVVADASAWAEDIGFGLTHLLQNLFRKAEFREGQIEVIARAISLQHTIGLLPTAAGKSLCYQLASMTQPGFCLVVDPLRSLMLDQEANLRAAGFHRCAAIMSGREMTPEEERISREQGYDSIQRGEQEFVFLAPERLQIPEFRDRLRSFTSHVPVPFCVVDEAHCVSEWGHDFRPAYLNAGRLVRDLCQFDHTEPTLVALTGTASRNVLTDIMRELSIQDHDAVVEPKSFDRKELQFEVVKCAADQRIAVIAGKLQAILAECGWRRGRAGTLPSGLIFSYFINNWEARDTNVPDIAEALARRLGLPVAYYAGGRPRGFSGDARKWEQCKIETQRRFKSDVDPILVCTHGFGMGIDKPSIRFIIHAMLPRSLEEFYQQAGRAGRDRLRSRCLVVFSDDQPELADEMLDPDLTAPESLREKANSVPRDTQGDAIRNTYFISNSFWGREKEKSIVLHVLDHVVSPRLPAHGGDRVRIPVRFDALPDDVARRRKGVRVTQDDKELALEKALYRLRVTGAIVDYLKDYSHSTYQVIMQNVPSESIYRALRDRLRTYVMEGDLQRLVPAKPKTSFRDAAFECAAVFIDYIYDQIEKRRRRATKQMLDTAREAASLGPAEFRRQLLAYLEESKFTKPVAEFATRIRPVEWFEVLARAEGADDIPLLLGACRRTLEEFPSHPGLLMLAGLTRMATSTPPAGASDIRSGFSALKPYYPDVKNRIWVADKLAEQTRRMVPSCVDSVWEMALAADPVIEMARFAYTRVGEYSQAHLSAVLVIAEGVLRFVDKKVR